MRVVPVKRLRWLWAQGQRCRGVHVWTIGWRPLYHEGGLHAWSNHVRTSFTSVGNEADLLDRRHLLDLHTLTRTH